MLAKVALGAVLVTLSIACVDEEQEHAVAATPITGPSGGRAWVLECENRRDCLWKAGRLCRFGYDIVDRAQQTSGGSFGGVSVGGAVIGHVDEDTTNTLTVECKH